MLDDVVGGVRIGTGIPPEDQTDPTGPDRASCACCAATKLDVDDRVILPIGYNRPANRAELPPAYGMPLSRRT